MPFHPYMHVERLGTDETEGLLDNDNVVVTTKIDGTNACVWWEDDHICAGSRKRKLSLADDNAGFCHWANGDNIEAMRLRGYCETHPNHIVYGEWLGANKFIGAIKSYNPDAKCHLHIFDVFDLERMEWLPDAEWRDSMSDYWPEFHFVAVLATLDHPTMEDIAKIASENRFLLDNADIVGEGVVCKAPQWRNKFGRQQHGKLVLDEYKQNKKRKRIEHSDQVEPDIVAEFVTDSELSKTIAKVCTMCDANAFDKKSAKMNGMAVSIAWNDLLSECPKFVKKYKTPTIDFALLKSLTQAKVRDYIGL